MIELVLIFALMLASVVWLDSVTKREEESETTMSYVRSIGAFVGVLVGLGLCIYILLEGGHR